MAEDFTLDFFIGEKQHIGNQGHGMASLFKDVQIFINPLVKQRLAEDVEEDRHPDPESMELVDKAADPNVVDVLLGTTEDIRRTEGAVHVAVAGELEEERPRRIYRKFLFASDV